MSLTRLKSWRRQWHLTLVLLPGKSHGQRSLDGCSPWGHWGSDTTEQLHFHFSLSCIGEGNGNPLQCSCLENPRDGGAWWTAIYGVAQSRTRLKWLSSSNRLKSRCQKGYILPGDSRRELVSLTFPFVEAPCILWLRSPSMFKVRNGWFVSLTSHHSDTDPSAFLLYFPGPLWLHWADSDPIQDNLPVFRSVDEQT